MQVSVEKINNVLCRLTIVVPANRVEEAYNKHINQLAKGANIKGFRRGKAPMSYIQQRFGNDARKEAMSEVIQESLYKAISEKQLTPVSTPQVETKVTIPNQPFEFIASFEVLPEIDSVKFSMDNVEKLLVEVKQEDVDLVIRQLQKQYTKWKIVDRPAKATDRVVLDYYVVFEGKSEEENKIKDFPLELGSKTMIPGFEEGLIGTQKNDEKVLNLSFPVDFTIPERAGKPIEFHVQVKDVFEADMPTIDEHFIQGLGIASGKEEELKQQIKETLERERDRLIREKLKEQIFRQLLEQNPIDVPSSLVKREAKNIHDEIYAQQHDHKHEHSNEEMASFNEIAKKRVALSLLITEYAKQANLKADSDKVKHRIQEIASAYESPREVITWLSSEERRSGVEAQVLEDQVLEKLMEGIKVTEKEMSYAELKGIRL